MNSDEYWEKHVEKHGDGMNCGVCKSRFNLGWAAALKYGSENSSSLTQEDTAFILWALGLIYGQFDTDKISEERKKYVKENHDRVLPKIGNIHEALPVKEEEMKMENDQLRSLFHRIWTKHVSAVGYDKEEWQQLQKLLRKQGVET